MCQNSYVEIAINCAKYHILIVPEIDFTVQLTHHIVIWRGARGLITDHTHGLHWASFHRVLADKALFPIILVRKGDTASLSSFTCSWDSSQPQTKGMKYELTLFFCNKLISISNFHSALGQKLHLSQLGIFPSNFKGFWIRAWQWIYGGPFSVGLS